MTQLRRTAGCLVLLGLAIFVVLSYTPLLRQCREALAATGNVVELCGPITAADLPLVGVILVVALLCFWPDLSEASVSGLLSVKRRVKEVEERTEQLTSEVRDAEERIVNPINLGETAATSGTKPLTLPGLPNDTEAPPPGTDLTLTGEFLAAWASLAAYAELPIPPGVQSSNSEAARQLARLEGLVAVSPLDLAAIREWRDTYRKELGDLRMLRNVVTHAPTSVPPEDVRRGTDAAKRLLGSLFAFRERIRVAEEGA